MKITSLPFLKSFLLLTVCVGLLGNAKIILLHNDKHVNHALMASVSAPSERSASVSLMQFTRKPLINEQLLVDQNSRVSKDSSNKDSANKDLLKSLADEIAALEASINISTESLKSIPTNKLSDVTTDVSINPTNPTHVSSESEVNDTSDESQYQDKLQELNIVKLNNANLSNDESSFDNDSENVYESNNEDSYENDVSSGIENTVNNSVVNDYAFSVDLAMQAERRLQSNVTYDGRYIKIGYPMGDVPASIGVCTDVVIRAFRGLGVDLQQRVHEDMKRNFRRYPNNWQLKRPDSNIDHRRVPNLMTYFKRANMSVGISSNPSDYHPGDIVAWDMGNGLTHIGVVSTYVSEKSGNPLIVHNIGVGPEMTDILFDFKIIGHYKPGKFNKVRLASLGS